MALRPWFVALCGVAALLVGVRCEFGAHWFNGGLMLVGVLVVGLAVWMSRDGS